ncbi:hypothetical protein LL256_10315 [Enterococcus faecalis]|uniref:hypothetical protein n=1 Tax=Enterococcus faecalis TaxID=1351 RepID=UPI001D19269F|nr:hypothetical protein [Enterococcus faecalis]MCC4124082.1 hypothetical protein [Enterococcus faecalis]
MNLKNLNINNLNIVIATINLCWGIYNTRKVRSLASTQNYASKLIEQIFIPFYENIECELFKGITEKNKSDRLKSIKELHEKLIQTGLLFYISDSLLIPLETLVAESNKKEDLLTGKKINKVYRAFSKNYYSELNRTRKIIGLKARTPNFRIHHSLYKYKLQVYLLSHIEITIFLLFLAFQLFTGIYSMVK